jgi:hypothetical protein
MNYEFSKPVVFVLGCIGASAEEIVRLYGFRAKLHKMKFSWQFFLISAVYAALGGGVAVVLPAVNYYAALYAGITMPVMISTIAKHRYHPVALSNERPDAPIQASRPSAWQELKELIQDHADRLF